jgi:hypothetical protein
MAKGFFPSLAGWVVLSALGGLCVAGCGSGAVVPVQGTVTVDGKPLPGGTVVFHPDPAGDGTPRQEARATIQLDGSYHLSTNGRPGAVPGRYKVCIIAVKARATKAGGWTVQPLIAPKFGSPATSGLEVEVGPDQPPGAYDLALQGTRPR